LILVFVLLAMAGVVLVGVTTGDSETMSATPSHIDPTRIDSKGSLPADSVTAKAATASSDTVFAPGNDVDAPASATRPGAIRFDPATWPALPGPTARVAEQRDAMKERAARGDTGAACWLGAALYECTRVLANDRAQTAWFQQSARRSRKRSANDREAALAQESKRLAMIERCQGVGDADRRTVQPMLRQAAFGGSRYALNQLMRSGPFPETPGMPDGAQVRQMLEDHEALIWAGLRGGVPEVIDPFFWTMWETSIIGLDVPGQSPLGDRERAALNYAASMLRDRLAGQPGLVTMLPEGMPGAPDSRYPLPDEATRNHLGRLVATWVNQDWSTDFAWMDDKESPEVSDFARSCASFTDPVDAAIDLNQALFP